MRGDQCSRQWKILQLIESRKTGITVPEMQRELGCNVRTIYRDLEALQVAGFPLYTDRDDGVTRWKLLGHPKTNNAIPFTMTELMALHLCSDFFTVLEGTIFQESFDELFAKIKTLLPPETRQYTIELSKHLKFGFGPRRNYSETKEIINTISNAVSERRQLCLTYKAASTQNVVTREVDPYYVWCMNGTFYLIGKCHARDDIRTFCIDRIDQMQVLDQRFIFPRNFSLDQYLSSAFRVMTGPSKQIKIQFESRVAHLVLEKKWHHSQHIEELEDGSIALTLNTAINYEIISWIMGFGSAANVLEPDHLRKHVMRECDATLKKYTKHQSDRK